MKAIFNTFIIKAISLIPSFIIWQIAKRYVAGKKKDDALAIVETLNKKGYSVTLDILGEHTQSKYESIDITNQYIDLLKKVHHLNLDCNISIKPSHIGLDINSKCINTNLQDLLNNAARYNNFIRIDMEDSTLTDRTLNLYRQFNKNHPNIGIVLQSYLFRTTDDLIKLEAESNILNFRLCKGIYKENVDISWQDKHDINDNFIQLMKMAFENNIYIGIATHDNDLIEKAYDLITSLQVPKNKFEFQVLYGVPMSGWLKTHLQNNYKVRIYVPFGENWYDYSIRRLKENPNIAGYIIKDLFKK